MTGDLDALLSADETGRSRVERVSRERRVLVEGAAAELEAARASAVAQAEQAVRDEIVGIGQRAAEEVAARVRARGAFIARTEVTAAAKTAGAVDRWCRIIEGGPVA